MKHLIIQEDLENILAANLPWNNLAGKTVLISGANGFLPAYIVEALLFLNEYTSQEKTKIIALVRNKKKFLNRFSMYQERKELNLIVQDVCSPILIDNKVDYIIHAASQASPKYYGKDPVGTLSANVIGTYNLLNLAKDNPVENFLFFSSGEVYGEVQSSQIPTKESDYGYVDPTKVRSCYAESKRMGETMCVSWCHQYGIPTKIVRPFHTYGPGMSLDDGRVYADFIANIVNNTDIVMKSDGSAIRAFCYLADAIQGFLTVLLKGEDGQAYNVGNDRGEASILDLANRLVSLFPEKRLKVVKQEVTQPPGYLRSNILRNCPDISKVRGLGWEPTTSVEEGFHRTIRSFL
ncbi:NAD-dependent epimerase/dehydratase family protein [Microcoleus sp. A003_D6]|uniref:NAD-dependent epimerase/dehydratase family protein n=1 Tax=Microcoleus sp. A003_D6 TaxID=3055266 RepID=UPI002FD01AD2